MHLEKELQKRSGHSCELCKSTEDLDVFEVPPISKQKTLENSVYLCNICSKQVIGDVELNANHWRCLNDSMWSEHTSVQVLAWRMLHRLKDQGWSQDLLDMLYLDEETLKWAQATNDHKEGVDDEPIHRDSNGVPINAGDSVVLIKDLPVKGTSFVAKRGTAVRRVTLDHDNVAYIEGKVEGQRIVIVTKYVKKI